MSAPSDQPQPEPQSPGFGAWMGSLWGYTILRFGMFFALWGLLLLVGLGGMIAALLALVLSIPLSLVLLAGPRNRVARNVEARITAARSASGQPLPLDTRDLSTSIGQWVLEKGEPLHLMDAQSDNTFQVQKSVMALGLRTVFAVPIAYDGHRYGVLYLDNQRMVDANPAGLRTLAKVGELVGAFLSRQPG